MMPPRRTDGRRQVRVRRGVYGARPVATTPVRRTLVRWNVPWRSLMLTVVGLVALVLAWQATAVTTIEVSGASLVPREQIAGTTRQLLNETPWFSNVLLVQLAGLGSKLTAKDQRLKTASIGVAFPHTLKLRVQERVAGLVWTSAGKSWLIDADGVAVAPATGNPAIPAVSDSANLPVRTGQRVAPARFVQFCNDINQGLSKVGGLTIVGFTVPESTSEVLVKTQKGYFVKFDTTRPAAEQLGDLQTVLKTLGDKQPSNYIDLRVAGRAYYK